MRNLATLLFTETLRQRLVKLLNDTRPVQSAEGPPLLPTMSTQDQQSAMDTLMAALNVLQGTHRDLMEWSDPQLAASPDQFAFKSDTVKAGLEEANLILVPRTAVQRLLEQSMGKDSPHAKLPKLTVLTGIDDYRRVHPFGFLLPHLQRVACTREDWRALLDVSWHALDNHIGLLGTIGLQLALMDPRKETATRLKTLMDGLATMCPGLPAMQALPEQALHASEVLTRIESMYSLFRTWHATVVKIWDVSHTYLLPDVPVHATLPAVQADMEVTVPRSLEKSLFPDALRMALHNGVRRVLGYDDPDPTSQQAQADDDLSTHLRTAQNLLYTYNKRYLAAAKLEIKLPSDVITNPSLANYAREAGLVMLPSKPVQELVQVLHRKEDAISRAFPRLSAPYQMKELLNKHPFGFELMHRGLVMVACRPGSWQEHLALMQVALQHHAGILIGIGFQLALKDRGAATRQGLQSMLDELSGIVDLAEVRRSLEDAPNSSNSSDGLEAAHAQFTSWFLNALPAGEVSSSLPPFAPVSPGRIDARAPTARGVEVSSTAQVATPAWTDSELIQLIGQKAPGELGELSKLLEQQHRAEPEPTLPTGMHDGLLPERISSTSLLSSMPETELSDGLLPPSSAVAIARAVPVAEQAPVPGPQGAAATDVSRPRPPRDPAAQTVISGSATVASNATIGKSVKICAGARILSRASIGDGATIGANAVIGEHSIVEPGARVGASVTLPAYTRVAPQAEITSLDLRPNVRLAQGTVLHGNVICFANVVLQQACHLGAGVEIGGNIRVSDAVTFSNGAKVNAWKVPKGTRGLTAGGSLVVENNGQLGKNVTIGAEVVIQEEAIVGDGARLGNHVKVAAGKRVGAGAQIADGLEVFADVPPGAVVAESGTTPDGSRYAHMIRPFSLAKSGVAQPHKLVSTAAASTPSARTKPDAPAPQLAGPDTVRSDTASSSFMETEVLALHASTGQAPKRLSAPVAVATPSEPVSLVSVPKRADMLSPGPKKKRANTEAVAEAAPRDRQSAPSNNVEGRERPRGEVARPLRPTTRSMTRVDVRSLPPIGQKAAVSTNIKRSSTVAELPDLPSKKRHKPDVVSHAPVVGSATPVLPERPKSHPEKPAQKRTQAGRLDLLLDGVEWAGVPSKTPRSTVTVPTGGSTKASAQPSAINPPVANVGPLSRSSQGPVSKPTL